MGYSFYESLFFSSLGLLALSSLLVKKNFSSAILVSLEVFFIALYCLFINNTDIIFFVLFIGLAVFILAITEKYFSHIIPAQEKHNFIFNFFISISICYVFFNLDVSFAVKPVLSHNIAIQTDFFSIIMTLFALLCIPFCAILLLKNDKKNMGEHGI